jgi:hypothetical protein
MQTCARQSCANFASMMTYERKAAAKYAIHEHGGLRGIVHQGLLSPRAGARPGFREPSPSPGSLRFGDAVGLGLSGVNPWCAPAVTG